jgi:carboxypeptidase C (cathepsin A)
MLEPPFAANITAKCYEGGHMMYDEPEIRRQVTRDVASFYKQAVAASAAR